jgi:hypothetical protein
MVVLLKIEHIMAVYFRTTYFESIILESGSFLNPWALPRNARNNAFGTAQILYSTFQNNDNSQDLLQYLQVVDAKELNMATGQYFASVRSI